jgi:outer membrane murein-binding lipoprotein Lpp
MKNLTVILLVISALFLAACRSDEPSVTDQVAEKVDQINTRNADAIVKHIKTPIEKARMTQNLGEERTQAIDQALKNQ